VSSIRVALLTEIPAPFRIPLFNELATRPDLELRVLFLSERDPKRPYRLYTSEFRFAWRTLPGLSLVRRSRWLVLSWGAIGELRRFRPDVIVLGGWNQPAFWQGLLYARVRRRRAICWVESTSRDERSGASPLELAKRAMLRLCTSFIVPGRASRDYLLGLGVALDRITIAPNAVDETIFGARVAAARCDREELRRRLGLSGCVFFYAGRLDPEKGVDMLLGAFRQIPGQLVIAGGGSLEDELHSAAPEGVRFLGRLDRDELVSWYAAADVFVLPSRSDQWGMVLNEAAAAGLPLVSTEAPGAAWDLIEHGVNGFRVPVDVVDELADALAQLAGDAELRERAGVRSRELAAAHSPSAWADAVVAASAGAG
jgi:glycosyltransferase involved in cell wall biosynthesis